MYSSKGIIGSSITACSRRDHRILNSGWKSRLMQPTAVLRTGRCHITLLPREKFRPLRCLLSKFLDHLFFRCAVTWGVGVTVTVQLLLLETSWRDMLLISLAQSNITVDWNQALLDAAAARPWMTSADVKALSTQASQLSNLVQRLHHMKLDVTEYTCLKALVLFKPGKIQTGLRFVHTECVAVSCGTPPRRTAPHLV